ncbi:transcriptional regulator [Wolbachia endosymbiont of Armadillidium vulgare str. wVulC]|nr:hypothetical protein [Wolbachia endosymbiont of Cylisticus convexus]KLT23360.1 transcriptional regulator [Wolbachia endosymbiont of Armadillidium vulgare str. wVulC]
MSYSDTSSKEISRLVREYRKIKDGTLRDIIHSRLLLIDRYSSAS